MLGDAHYQYIFPLFYLRIHPEAFRSTAQYYSDDALGLSQVKGFGNYHFIYDDKELTGESIILKQIVPDGGYFVTHTP